MDKSKLHIIYTDGSSGGGSSHGNGDIGSWAFIELDRDELDGEQIQRKSGYVYGTTNNRMEMQAIINGVRSLPFGSMVSVFSDSGYCVDGYNNPSYLKKWIQNGWRTSKKLPVENKDLWLEFIEIDKLYNIQMTRIRGHKKDPNKIHSHWNEECDHMCTDMRLLAVNKFTDRNVQIPMECPTDCKFSGQLMDQGGYCYSCPVILCKDPDPLVSFGEYRDDWLIEWDKFFKGEIEKPILKLVDEEEK
jgi:ribonuclease HI